MDDGQVPPTLKQLAPILKHAAQVRTQLPAMGYLCSLYAIQLGLKIKGADPASKAFLIGLMDRLERQRAELGPTLSQIPDQKAQKPSLPDPFAPPPKQSSLHLALSDEIPAFATNFAVKVFGHADDEYRAGLATRETAKNFYSATVFFDVLRQFDDPLPDEIENMRKYAKYSAVQITKAVKQGVPVVHPDSQDTQDNFGDGGGDFDPFSAAAGFPTISSSPSLGVGSPSMPDHSPPYGGSPAASHFGGAQSFTQPTPFGHSGGGFDSPSDSSFAHRSRGDTPPSSSSPSSSSASSFSSFAASPPPAHGFPYSFDNGGYPATVPSSQPPPPPGGAPSMDSIDQLLSLFPTVPSVGGGSGSGSPSMTWSSSPSSAPPHHPSSAAPSSAPPPAASQPQPRTGPAPSAQARAPVVTPAPAPASAPVASAPAAGTVGGYAPSAEAVEKAQKYARFAVSAMQFEDLPYAVQNLQQALSLLTGKQYN